MFTGIASVSVYLKCVLAYAGLFKRELQDVLKEVKGVDLLSYQAPPPLVLVYGHTRNPLTHKPESRQQALKLIEDVGCSVSLILKLYEFTLLLKCFFFNQRHFLQFWIEWVKFKFCPNINSTSLKCHVLKVVTAAPLSVKHTKSKIVLDGVGVIPLH